MPIYDRNGIQIEYEGGLGEQHLGFIFDEMFDLGMYDTINVQGKDVLDVGAYLGETAIYFSRKGARRVIAIEPFWTFGLIEKNAQRNDCQNIDAYRCAYAAHPGTTTIQKDYINHGATRMRDGQQYVNDENKLEVRAITLKEMVDEFDLSDAILKMDVEGAEREGILASDADTLRHFSQIVLEYHYVPMYEGEELAKFEAHLRDAGFDVHHVNNKAHVCMVYANRLERKE